MNSRSERPGVMPATEKSAADHLKRLSMIRELPTMPAVLVRLNRMLQDEVVSIDKIGHLIETDQAISSKILMLVNSAFFGFRSRVSSIPHALMILGFNTVRSAAISVSLIDAIRIGTHKDGFDVIDFWRHSIAVAVAARYLGRQLRMKDPDDAFTAGLLHDVGKLVMLQFLPELFDVAWAEFRRGKITFIEAEQKKLPLNHAMVGAHLARMWQFPADLVEAIAHHHEPPLQAVDAELIWTVYLANLAANHNRFGTPPDAGMAGRYPGHEVFVKDHVATVSHWFGSLEGEIEKACSFFLEGGA